MASGARRRARCQHWSDRHPSGRRTVAFDLVFGLAEQHSRPRLRLDAERHRASPVPSATAAPTASLITALELGSDRQAMRPLVVRRSPLDPLGPRRGVAEPSGDEEQLTEAQCGVGERPAYFARSPRTTFTTRGRRRGTGRRATRRRLVRVRRRPPLGRRGAAARSAASTCRRNCHRSTSTHGGGARATVSPSMRSAGQLAARHPPGFEHRHASATSSHAGCVRPPGRRDPATAGRRAGRGAADRRGRAVRAASAPDGGAARRPPPARRRP